MKSDNKNKVYACFISLLNFIFACFRVVETMARNTSNDRETTSAFWSLWQDHERCWKYGGQFGKSCITSRQFSTTFPQPTRPRKSYRRTQGKLILLSICLLGSAKGASIKDIRFWGRWVGFQKSDITMLNLSSHWVKIGDGWVGRSKNGPKNRISFTDGP